MVGHNLHVQLPDEGAPQGSGTSLHSWASNYEAKSRFRDLCWSNRRQQWSASLTERVLSARLARSLCIAIQLKKMPTNPPMKTREGQRMAFSTIQLDVSLIDRRVSCGSRKKHLTMSPSLSRRSSYSTHVTLLPLSCLTSHPVQKH